MTPIRSPPFRAKSSGRSPRWLNEQVQSTSFYSYQTLLQTSLPRCLAGGNEKHQLISIIFRKSGTSKSSSQRRQLQTKSQLALMASRLAVGFTYSARSKYVMQHSSPASTSRPARKTLRPSSSTWCVTW